MDYHAHVVAWKLQIGHSESARLARPRIKSRKNDSWLQPGGSSVRWTDCSRSRFISGVLFGALRTPSLPPALTSTNLSKSCWVELVSLEFLCSCRRRCGPAPSPAPLSATRRTDWPDRAEGLSERRASGVSARHGLRGSMRGACFGMVFLLAKNVSSSRFFRTYRALQDTQRKSTASRGVKFSLARLTPEFGFGAHAVDQELDRNMACHPNKVRYHATEGTR